VDEIAGDHGSASRVKTTKPPADFGAYVVYKRAMHAVATAFGDFRKAEQLFREAIDVDPKYAPAWGGLAHVYWLHSWYRQMPAAATMPLCKQAAQRTLELDADAAECHCSLGIVASGFEWRWREAEAHFERAIALQPSLAMIYPFYAVVCLFPQRKLDKACAMIDRSLALDPFNGLFLVIGALIYSWAGRHDEARRLHRLGQDLSPSLPPTGPVHALQRELEGDVEGAIEELRVYAPGRPEMIGFLGHALARAGRRYEALECIEQLRAQPISAALDIARVQVGLRDTDEALRWLSEAVAQRAVHLILLPADPRFDWLRTDSRYWQVIRPMGLAHGDGAGTAR
jgi:serine/threonine-protein kinase